MPIRHQCILQISTYLNSKQYKRDLAAVNNASKVCCLSLFVVLGIAGQAIVAMAETSSITIAGQTISASPPNASTQPNQPSLFPITGSNESIATTTGAGSAAICAPTAGNPACAGTGNPINVMTGNKYQQETDMPALPGPMGIEIVRHYNSLHMGLGQIGYGWRLGYEIDLTANQNSIHISKADGSQTIFNRSVFNPSDCACQDPAQGHVVIYHTTKGNEYTWFMLNGKQLHFNHMGKLERITAPTGESVHLTRGLRGELLKVTDPQGRSLIMHYADKKGVGFKGVVAIDTPVGRFNYQHNNDLKSAGVSNLIQVTYPSDKTRNDHSLSNEYALAGQQQSIQTQASAKSHIGLTKTYHYGEAQYVDSHMLPANMNRPQIPHAAHLLTGTSLTWSESQSDKPQAKTVRQRTWMYDAYGRGILSVHGTPNSKDATQQVKLSYHVVPLKSEKNKPLSSKKVSTIQTRAAKVDTTAPHTQAYPRITHHGQIGQTVITNSQGQATTYNYTLIAGEYRLLQVIGAGCAECTEPNVVYAYDKLGRQTDMTKVALHSVTFNTLKPNAGIATTVHASASTAKTASYTALQTTHTDYDQSGRVLKVSRIRYNNGKPQPAQLQVRYEYPNIPVFPQPTTAKRAVLEPVQVFSQPSLIAKPSVVVGKEHQWHIRYNQHGQPLEMIETGYRPAAPTNKPNTDKTDQPISISRTTTYGYSQINGRSLLVQVDAPLPNGKISTPQDSDITQYQYDKLGQYLIKITAPNNFITQLEYDTNGSVDDQRAETGGTGRIVKRIGSEGITTQFGYNMMGKVLLTQRYPTTLDIAAAKHAGLLQTTAMAYDVFGNTTMVQGTDGQAITMQYGTDGKMIAMKDGLGNRVEWKDWAKATNDNHHTVTTQQWFTSDAPDTVARAWYFWHDNQNRLTQRLSPDGGIDTWRYSDSKSSNLDQSLQADAANDSHWVQHIDPLNRMTLNVLSSQASSQIRMTPAGYLEANFTLNAHSTNTKHIIDSSSQATQIADDYGRVVLFRSAQHGTHIAQYNTANRITHIQQPDGTRIHYSYDVAGRMLSKTASSSIKKAIKAPELVKDTVQYSYDAFGLNQIKDSTQNTTYTKDLLGREIDKATTLVLQNNKTNTYHIRTRYDALGRIHAKQLIDGQWLVFSLDDKTGLTKALRLHNTIWPSLTNRLAAWLNLPDLPLQIATTKTVVANITIHPFNGITHLTHGNGISDDYGFDLAGRLTNISHGVNTGTHAQHQTHPNTTQAPLNNKTGSFITQASYTYDAGRRLSTETFTDNTSQPKTKQYVYQGWNQLAALPKTGFIKAVVSNRPLQLNSISNDADLAQPQSEYPSAVDIAGHTVADTHYRYSYNVWGKLSSVQTNINKNIIARYQHNALGERVMAVYPQQKNSKATQTHYYLYDKQQRIAEIDENGNVLQQYLYINQTPVAVINTPTNQTTEYNPANKESSPAGIIAIHTDRRHAPIAATDEQGKVIWQTQYDAWGKASIPSPFKGEGWGEGKISPINNAVHEPVEAQQQTQAQQQNTFNLALRLPGQWQDQATGLHYNYQRDYNPSTGKYLTPDPLGFPDGADPYAYVNNDPLNKADPLGLYEIDVHYYMTYFLGVMAGLSEFQARVVASGAQYVDDNPFTQPLPHSLTQAAINIALENPDVVNRLSSYHFTQFGHDPANPNPNNTNFGSRDDNPQYVRERINNPNNPQLARLLAAANANYIGAPCKTIKEQLFGEYLHAFEDTFGHRDQLNAPISINAGFGHGVYLHEPDKTYNDTSLAPGPAFGYWYTRQARTLEMEKEVFAQIQKNFGVEGVSKTTNKKIAFDDILGVLEKFNAVHETEESTNNLYTGSEKLKILNNFLTKNGFREIPTYNIRLACKFRQNTIFDIAASSPPGVILGTPLNCTSVRGE